MDGTVFRMTEINGRKIMEIYIVRHGRTVWNKAGLIQGSSDVELLQEGIDMAIETGQGLASVDFDAVYSSPLSRAVNTAQLIMAARGEEDRKNIQINMNLSEMGFGVCEGEIYVPPGEEGGMLEGFWDAPETYVAPEGGDTFADVIARAAAFIEHVEKVHSDDERILVVAHAAMNQALMSVLEGREIKDFWKYGKQLNCAVAIACRENGQWQIHERNRIYYDHTAVYK